MEQSTTNQNIIVEDREENPHQNSIDSTTDVDKETVNVDGKKIVEWICYVVGIAFIIIAFIYLGKDLDYNDGPFDFYEKRYVGGDAYNFIISATRSSAVMVKSLVWMVAGCTALIFGRLTALIKRQ